MHGSNRASRGAGGSAPCDTARKSTAGDLLLTARLSAVRQTDGEVVWSLRGGRPGLLPDAQPGSADRGAIQRTGAGQGDRAGAREGGEDDGLVRVEPLLYVVGDWRQLPPEEARREQAELLRKYERTGRPLGGESFVSRVEKLAGRVLRKAQPAPSPRRSASGDKLCVPGTPGAPGQTRMRTALQTARRWRP